MFNVWLYAGGPKLRKWYGAPDLLPKDGATEEDEDGYPGNSICNLLFIYDRAHFKFHRRRLNSCLESQKMKKVEMQF